jgi:hypothetical protein
MIRLIASSDEKSIQILQDFARDHSLGRNDVHTFSSFAQTGIVRGKRLESVQFVS